MLPLLIGYGLALALFLGLPWSRRMNPALKTDAARTRRTAMVLGFAHLAGLTVPLAAFLSGVGPRVGPGVSWAAVLVMAASLCLQRWAQHSLGTCFTLALQCGERQPVCNEGPYRWVRHPAYSAQILFWCALGLASGSITAAALVGAVAVPAYAYRLGEEERMLVSALGSRYAAYTKETRRLIPFLW